MHRLSSPQRVLIQAGIDIGITGAFTSELIEAARSRLDSYPVTTYRSELSDLKRWGLFVEVERTGREARLRCQVACVVRYHGAEFAMVNDEDRKELLARVQADILQFQRLAASLEGPLRVPA